MNALTQWYRSREPREQRILSWGGIAVLLIIIVGGWLQLRSTVLTASERLNTKRADLAWLQMQAPQIVAARNSASGAPSNEPLVVLIDRVARSSGLAEALAGSQQNGGPTGGYRVRLEKASFDATVAFLGQLALQNGVSIESAGIDAAGDGGVVNAALVLRKP